MTNKTDMTVAEQIADLLRSQIRSGALLPDTRLPGERKLSEQYGVCRATIIAALDKLKDENLIKKIPARGNFVLRHDLAPKILLLYPEKTLGKTNHPENTASFLEFYHGLLDSAAINKCEMSTLCITEEDFNTNPKECINKVSNFDVIIFPSAQLLEFRKALYGKKVLIVRNSMLPNWEKEPNVSVITLDYNNVFKQLANKAIQLGFDKITVLTMGGNNWLFEKRKFMKSIIEEAGLYFEEINCPPQNINNVLPKLVGKFVFFNNMVILGDFYNACSNFGLCPGKDFQLTGLCFGNTILNLNPKPSYFQVPSYEIGQAAFKLAIEKTSNKFIQIATYLNENDTIRKGKKC